MLIGFQVPSLLVLVLIATVRTQESDFDDKTCGRQQVPSEGLVKGGFKVRAGEFPWHVAVFHRVGTTSEFDYHCGGTLVHKFLIVTAAHCVTLPMSRKRKTSEDILIKVGRFNISAQNEEHGQEYGVAQVLTHRSYKPLSYENDIAIVKLLVPVIFTLYIQPACLWKRDDGIILPDPFGLEGTIVGWGLKDDDKPSSVLNTARMPVVNMHECLQSDREFFGHLLHAKSFCAGHKNGTGVCNGDSGGGMVFKHLDQWYLRGVVSYSNTLGASGICNLQQYVGFTDAALYLDWIYENAPINENSDRILGHPNIRLINQGNCGKNEFAFDYQEEKKPLIQQYTWMVTLRNPLEDHERVPCNGVLINRNYILSTWCVNWNDDIEVILGEYITLSARDCAPRDDNPHFCTDPVQYNSIAEFDNKDELILGRLSTPAYIGRREHIQAICLPTTPEQRDRIYPRYITTGWEEAGNDSQYLQRALLGTIPRDICREEMANYEYARDYEKNITDHRLCVRNSGDSKQNVSCNYFQRGTVLQAIDEKSNRYTLYGLQMGISYCSRPEVYIAVGKYIQWILDTMRP